MLKEIYKNNVHFLYEYFNQIRQYSPQYFPVSFDMWDKSMFDDYWIDGKPLFKELKTILYYEDNLLKGFIQFGISRFIFTDDGIDETENYAIIRNIHYSKDSKNPEEMVEKAFEFFGNRFKEISAFFHIFGMSCYARHGKLHNSAFYIEQLLYKFSFIREHENIYFSKNISVDYNYNDPEIEYERSCIEPNKEKITFSFNNIQIGYCEIAYFHENISYLYYIEINKEFRHKNFGTRCMNIIFEILQKRNVVRLDLDTIDSNYIAQNFYTKLGFIYKGITRSYYIDKNAPTSYNKR